ncbi:MAG: P-type conjugative transfer protein TrbG [Bacillota bacterium]
MIRSTLLIPSMLGLAACASGSPAAPDPAFMAATLVTAPKPAAKPIAAVQAASRPSRHAGKRKHRHPDRPPVARVAEANRAAVHEPDGDSYVGAAQVYPWSEGGLYRLYTAPGEVSDIALQPGEALVSVAAGDTARWVIGDTRSGAGADRRVHILVKPSRAGLSTNLVIATDRRVYHVELESTAGTSMASVSWSYPENSLLALGGSGEGAYPAFAASVESLNFAYRVEGDRPAWRPLRAFDDGRQVYIEFPRSLAAGDAPPLFVTGDGGRPELVNYRIRGRYYVVDRLFAAAELRLGERKQQVVRIVRDERRGRDGRNGS